MSGIFNGIQAILDTLSGAIRLIGLIISTIINYFSVVGNIVSNIFANITTIPTYIQNYMILSASIVIIMLLVGRKAGD